MTRRLDPNDLIAKMIMNALTNTKGVDCIPADRKHPETFYFAADTAFENWLAALDNEDLNDDARALRTGVARGSKRLIVMVSDRSMLVVSDSSKAAFSSLERQYANVRGSMSQTDSFRDELKETADKIG